MDQLIVLVFLFLIIFGMLVTSFWKLSTNDTQQKYMLRGLVLAVVVVFVFSVGSWLIGVRFASILDTGYIKLGGWIIAMLTILLFLDQSRRRTPMHKPLHTLSAGVISQVYAFKIRRMDKVIISGFRNRYPKN